MLLFAASVMMLVAAAAAVSAGARLHPPGFLLAVYLLVLAQIVLLTESLSLLHVVGRVGYLVGQLPLLVAAIWWWNRCGRPGVPLPRLDVGRGARGHPIVAALAVVVAIALLYELFLGLTVPANNWDALTYHLSRAVGWLHAHAVEYLPAHSTRENVHPPNAEMQIMYTFAFLSRDTLAAAPQFVAEVALLVAVYGCARRTGTQRAASLFAALLFATLTQVALQASSAQNDLVAAAPVAACAYFVLGGCSAEIALAGIALGIAVGTKWTVLPVLPALALIAIAALRWKQLGRLAVAAAAGVALLGAYGYVLNVIESGTPLGVSPEQDKFIPHGGDAARLATALRIAYDFGDLSGLHVPEAVVDAAGRVGRAGFRVAHIDANPRGATAIPFVFRPNTSSDEDLSFFGPLGLLLVLPLCAVFATRVRSDPRRAALALALPVYVVGVSLGHAYDPWSGRYVTMAVALVMPLAATLYERRSVSAATAFIAAITLACALAFNVSKPFSSASWSAPRAEAQTIRRPDLRPVFEWVDRHVPANATVGIRIGTDDPDYPLYGPQLRRKLVPLATARDARGFRYVVTAQMDVSLGAGWRTFRFPNGWRALVRPESAGGPTPRAE